MKKMNKKGFTLAELLIVVAIIAVLVAIAIPVFTTQLEKSREAVDASNIRAAYAEAMSEYLTNGGATVSKQTVGAKQKVTGWDNTAIDWSGMTLSAAPTAKTDGSAYTVTVTAPTTAGNPPTVSVS